ncbi:MAG: AmmeMemoRadiSam system protein B [Candidatus Buchananbacteria bacterium]|nr:AmmeMemoRadiSam system protein B [Candidatus Buchananbacteria bacterium]
MRTWVAPAIGLGLVSLTLTGIAFEVIQTRRPPATPATNNNLHYAGYSQREFYTGLENPSQITPIKEKVYGGIVSHHFFVEKEIAKFFLALKKQRPKTVVIIGPNHFNVGKSDILVSQYAYETPYGVLDPDHGVINQLTNVGTAKVEEQPFEREHSISTLVGFAKATFPEAQIVPIIVKRGAPQQRLDELVDKLDSTLPADSLVIASVDFSHHQNRMAAQFHDERSIAAIKSFEFEAINNLEIDSPPSIYVLLRYLERRGGQRVEYQHVNSAEYSKNLASEDVTSYLFAHFLKGQPEPTPAISVLSFGDMMFDRAIKAGIKETQNPFAKIIGVEGNFFKGVDFISANLEGPITADCDAPGSRFKFATTTGNLLSAHGINIVNLANNHTPDCGPRGLEDTRQYLSNANVSYFGDQGITSRSYVLKKVDGQTIAFLGVNALSLSPAAEQQLLTLVTDIKSKANYLVVNIHWGVEYNTSPSTEQRQLAHKLIDNGADVILGHHPHVIQPLETYKDKAIFYSLGNFIFDQVDPETRLGLAVGTAFINDAIQLTLFPFGIDNYQPALLPYTETENFCDLFLQEHPRTDICTIEL